MGALVFPSMVRDQVLEQHAQLREILERVIVDATFRQSAARESGGRRLEATARELCQRFRDHLAFEDEVLRPVFAVIDAWGPERVKDLGDEHDRQRRELDAFLARVELRDNVDALAVELRGLAEDLLRDMKEEEEGCLRADLLIGDSLPFERR